MSVKVKIVEPNHLSPFEVDFNGARNRLSKFEVQALKAKLDVALEEFEKYEAEMNHHANQSNPNNEARKDAMDNHANQCNPNYNDEEHEMLFYSDY